MRHVRAIPVLVAPVEGGQLQGKGVLVENYPAVTGITGPVIVRDMRKQWQNSERPF